MVTSIDSGDNFTPTKDSLFNAARLRDETRVIKLLDAGKKNNFQGSLSLATQLYITKGLIASQVMKSEDIEIAPVSALGVVATQGNLTLVQHFLKKGLLFSKEDLMATVGILMENRSDHQLSHPRLKSVCEIIQTVITTQPELLNEWSGNKSDLEQSIGIVLSQSVFSHLAEGQELGRGKDKPVIAFDSKTLEQRRQENSQTSHLKIDSTKLKNVC